jgi:hypothetical protein
VGAQTKRTVSHTFFMHLFFFPQSCGFCCRWHRFKRPKKYKKSYVKAFDLYVQSNISEHNPFNNIFFQWFGDFLPHFFFISSFSVSYIYNHIHTVYLSISIRRGLCLFQYFFIACYYSEGKTSMGCRAEIWTLAGQRTTNWATLFNCDSDIDMPISFFADAPAM